MPWFKVDDGFYSSQKVLSIPRSQRLAAVGLWTMAGNWSARELSDGVVPAYVLAEVGATPKLRQALVEARLWLDHPDGGIEFRNWAEYQPTRDQVEEDRRKSRERQQRHREEKRDAPVTNASVTRDSAVSHTVPTRPDPTPTEVSKETSKRGTRVPDSFAITDEMREWAKTEVPLVNVDAKLPEFMDYWRGVAGAKGVKRDWVSTWRNGMRKQQEFAERDGSKRPSAPRSMTAEEARAQKAEYQARSEALALAWHEEQNRG